MKRFLALGVPALVLSVAACGGDDADDMDTGMTTDTTTMSDTSTMSNTGMDNSNMNTAAMGNNNMGNDGMGSMSDMAMEPISVTIENVTSGEGSVLMGLQTQGQFATLNVSGAQSFDATGSSMDVMLVEYPSEPFAIAVFQDMNGNGTLDMDGATPTEPYGFSGDSQKGKAPSFGPARVDTGADSITVRLVK